MTADGRTKKKILGCIFSEKLVLEKGRVATTPFSEGVLILFKIFIALQGSEKKKEVISDLLSTNAPEDQEISNQFRGDVLISNELIKLYVLHHADEKVKHITSNKHHQ
jgi:hypothetical protein